MNLKKLKIRLQCSIGIYLGESHVSWCLLEKRPWGKRQIDAGEEPCVKQDWAVALHRILEKFKGDLGETSSIFIGLPASQAFFATLPAPIKNETAETLLANSHCCTSIPASDMAADMLPVKIGGKMFSSVAAGRRKDLAALTDVARKAGYRFIRVEPAPWALLRTSNLGKSTDLSLRLLIEGRRLIAALLCGTQPVLWRSIELGEDPADSIVSLVRSFESFAGTQLGIASIDSIVLEGPDVAKLGESLSGDLGERLTSVEGAGPTAAAFAKGLALGGLERDKPTPDIARSLAPPPRLSDLIPRGEVALLSAVVICMGLWMWSMGSIVTNKAKRVEEDIARSPMLKGNDDSKLKDEKKLLAAEVQAVQGFLQNRILWTDYLSQFSSRVPKGLQLVELHGEFEMQAGMKKNEKRSEPHVALMFEGMVPRHLSAPPEVDEVLENIRTAPVVVRDFPEVELTVLRVNKNSQSRKTMDGDPSTFTVTCYPKGMGPAKKAKPTKEDGGGAPPPATK